MSEAGNDQAFEGLLHAAERAAQAGKTQAALTLLRAITTEYPHEPRAWLTLAEQSDDAAERRAANERARVLDQERVHARARTAQSSHEGDWYAAPPGALADEPPRGRVAPWALYALALALLLAVAIPLYRLWRDASAVSGARPANGAAGPPASPTLPRATATALATATATVQPTAAVPPTPQPTLALGALAQRDSWSASLLRTDYSLFLDGAIGDQKPRGRFLLVLLALANGSDTAQLFPPEMLMLHDAQGRAYTPQPSLSTTYLAAYGRGQRGDLSLENALPPGGGLYSVPVIYDVPADASGFQLSLGDASGGAWPIGP